MRNVPTGAAAVAVNTAAAQEPLRDERIDRERAATAIQTRSRGRAVRKASAAAHDTTPRSISQPTTLPCAEREDAIAHGDVVASGHGADDARVFMCSGAPWWLPSAEPGGWSTVVADLFSR
jgi:hypothetical protein